MTDLRRAGLLLVGLSCVAFTRPAAAQETWVTTEVDVGAEGGGAQLATQVAESLRRRGQKVISGATAASEFAQQHSHPPVRPSTDELEQLDKALRALADHIASEDLEQTRSVLDKLGTTRPEVLDFLNRQGERARRRFHICLLTGHLLANQAAEEGLAHVRACVRDFPGFEPELSPYLPSSIRAFFARAKRKLKAIRPASLVVDVEAARGSDACRALVNGIDEGAVPATVENVRADSVRVQVECGAGLGRIYEVALKPGKNAIAIDPALDAAVVTRGALKLSYADRERGRALATGHAVAIGRALHADVVVEVIGNELRRVDVANEKLSVTTTVREGALDAAVAELLASHPDTRWGATTAGIPAAGVSTDVRAPASDANAPQDATSAHGRPSQPELPAPVGAKPLPTKQGGAPYATLGWVSVGAAAVAAAAAVVTWRMRDTAVLKYNNCANEPPADDVADPDKRCDTLYDSFSSKHYAEVGALVGTGVFAGLATLFFVLDANQDSSSVGEAPRARLCGPGPGDIGLSCSLRF